MGGGEVEADGDQGTAVHTGFVGAHGLEPG